MREGWQHLECQHLELTGRDEFWYHEAQMKASSPLGVR